MTSGNWLGVAGAIALLAVPVAAAAAPKAAAKPAAATAAKPAAATAAKPAAATAAKPAAAKAAAPVVTAEATQALARMGAYLRSLKTFQVVSTASTEEVYPNGQKLQFLQKTSYLIGGPEAMSVEIETDRQSRRIFYNGKTLTIAAPRAKLYTALPVTGTISEVLNRAYTDFGVEFPLQDLFRWGSPQQTAEKPAEGFKVGAAQIGEHATEHFAFRQPGVDWQVWIDTGDKPLPRKMVIANTEDPTQPEYVAYFQWDMTPSIASGSFDFKPGSDYRMIDFGAAAAGAGAGK